MKKAFFVLFACAAFVWPTAASASNVPAIEAFDRTFATVNDYTATVRTHEVLGDRVQDRTYHYAFKRPDMAKTDIVAGDGAGSGGVWKGGQSVRGHLKIAFFTIPKTVDLHDARATSLRGYTISDGLLQNEVDKYRIIDGRLTQREGPLVDGTPTEEVQLELADPARYGGVTRMAIDLSKTTHFPVRQMRFSGDKVVAEETFSDVKTNVGLRDSDFPF